MIKLWYEAPLLCHYTAVINLDTNACKNSIQTNKSFLDAIWLEDKMWAAQIHHIVTALLNSNCNHRKEMHSVYM